MLKQIWRTALTDVKTSDVEGSVGRLRYEPDGSVYRWVYNGSAIALSVGQLGYHKAADAASAFQKIYTFQEAGAANAAFMAGIVMGASLAAGSYGWIQVFGINDSASRFASGITAIAAGDVLKGGATASQPYAVYDAGYADVTAMTDSTGGNTSTTLAAPTAQSQGTPTAAGVASVTGNVGGTTTALATVTPTATYASADIVALDANIANIAAQLLLIKTDIANSILDRTAIKTDVANVKTNVVNYAAGLATRLAALITSKQQSRHLIAMEALASSVTVATAGRVFVSCM